MGTGVLISLFCCVWMVASKDEPSFIKTPKQVVAVKGTTAVLPCRVANLGEYNSVWSFRRNLLTYQDRRIVDDPRISVDRSYTTQWNLRIQDVKLEDAGTYSCQVNTNPIISQHVKLLVLNEQPAPVLPEKVMALAGADVEIKCKLPDINDIGTWSYKADERSPSSAITENDKFKLREGEEGKDSNVHTLVIRDVRAGDAGLYFCRARSGTQARTTLRVVVPPQPPSLEVNAASPNTLLVKWQKPSVGEAQVVGYVMYVLDQETGEEYTFEMGPGQDRQGKESFRVSDLTTNNTYTVQLATKLRLGGDITMGKRSPEVNITTPFFLPDAPGWVKVKRKSDSEATVMWSPPDTQGSGLIRGYTVTYTPLAKNKQPIKSRKKSVEVMNEGQTRWSVVLTGLRTKTRYQVQVNAFTRKGNGRLSRPIVYLHKKLPPELSLNGRVLSDNSVLLTVTTLGKGKMTNVKMYYTEASEPSWKVLDYSAEWKFTVVGGLDPRTSYFFMVKAKIGGRMKKSVTHITTPPHELLAPEGVSVSATASTSIEVKWDYAVADSSSPLPLGYIVHLEETSEQGDEGKHHSQQVVFNKTSVEVKDLIPGMRYTIQVVAFNGFGEGPRTEGILFHIAESDVKQDPVNEQQPPRFVHDLPERLQVESGEVVKISCVADGYPIPEVRWYVAGEPVGVPAQGSNELYLDKVVRHTTLTCRAKSQWGAIERTTVVEVIGGKEHTKQDLPKDVMALGLTPSKIRSTTFSVGWETILGDSRHIERFEIIISDGQDNPLLTQKLPRGTNSFNLRSLLPGTEYRVTLRAYGADGLLTEAKTSVMTLFSDRDAVDTTTRPAGKEHTKQDPPKDVMALGLTPSKIRSTTFSVGWETILGDSRQIESFDIIISDDQGNPPLTQKLQRRTNSFRLKGLLPGTEYRVTLRAYGADGLLTEAKTSVTTLLSDRDAVDTTTRPAAATPSAPEDSSSRTGIQLAVKEVTPSSAVVEWDLVGLDPRFVRLYDVKVKSKSNLTLLTKALQPNQKIIDLNLRPGQEYYVQIRAYDMRGTVLASNTTKITTPSIQDLRTTSLPRRKEDGTGRESPVLKRASLTLTPQDITGESARLDWSVVGARPEDIGQFLIKIKDTKDRPLLVKDMEREARSLTLSNLTPQTQYFVELLAVDGSGATIARTTTSLTTTSLNEDDSDGEDTTELRVYIDKLDRSMVKIAWHTPHKLLPKIREVVVVLKDINNKTLLTQRMTPLTGFLTVRNMSAGEKFGASVKLTGMRGETLRSGYLEFETEPTPGMPGRPRIVEVRPTDSTVRVEWVNTRSPAPAPGSDKILGHVINFARVDANNQPVEGTYQMPLFGATQFAVVPTLRSGQRYMFQVSARNRYSFGPLSEPAYVDLP